MGCHLSPAYAREGTSTMHGGKLNETFVQTNLRLLVSCIREIAAVNQHVTIRQLSAILAIVSIRNVHNSQESGLEAAILLYISRLYSHFDRRLDGTHCTATAGSSIKECVEPE